MNQSRLKTIIFKIAFDEVSRFKRIYLIDSIGPKTKRISARIKSKKIKTEFCAFWKFMGYFGIVEEPIDRKPISGSIALISKCSWSYSDSQVT